MAKKNKNKGKQEQTGQNTVQSAVEKTPEMLALEQDISLLNNKLFETRNKKAELSKAKIEAEKSFNKLEAEKRKQEEELQKLEKTAFEIREAIRTIDELKLTTHTESANAEILAWIQTDGNLKNSHGENDDKTLAVAARYKLNDIVLYTDDKNLRNKATAIGINRGD